MPLQTLPRWREMVLHALIQLVNVEEDGTPFLELTFCHSLFQIP